MTLKQVYNAVRYYKHTDMEQMPLSCSIFFLLNRLWFSSYTRACLKYHSCNLHTLICGIFCPYLVAVAPLRRPHSDKIPDKL